MDNKVQHGLHSLCRLRSLILPGWEKEKVENVQGYACTFVLTK